MVKELVDIALSGSNGDEISDIMKMKLADGGFEVSQAAGANLSNANVLRAQVLDSWLNPSLTISNELIEPSGYVSFEDGAIMVIESRDKKPDWSNNK